VADGTGVSVGTSVAVGRGVLDGTGVFVGTGVAVGDGVKTEQASIANIKTRMPANGCDFFLYIRPPVSMNEIVEHKFFDP
jgi:hypothetical protein